jgi:hypothetical protein
MIPSKMSGDKVPSLTFLEMYIASATLISTIVTTLGFIISNWIAWKKERRDRLQFELELEKRRLEVEKLQSELTAIRSALGKSD